MEYYYLVICGTGKWVCKEKGHALHLIEVLKDDAIAEGGVQIERVLVHK